MDVSKLVATMLDTHCNVWAKNRLLFEQTTAPVTIAANMHTTLLLLEP